MTLLSYKKGAEYDQNYWQHMDDGAGAQDSTMWEDIAHIIKETFCITDRGDESGSINAVDVGCGFGYLVRHLRRRGLDAWGLDISQYALDNAPEDIRSYLRWFDLEAPNPSHFGDHAFRLVTSFETFEHIHIEHAQQAASHVWNLLKPGGIAVLAICIEGREGAERDWTHVNVRSRSWWEQLFNRMGWIPEINALNKIRSYWLFRNYDGLFVLRKI